MCGDGGTNDGELVYWDGNGSDGTYSYTAGQYYITYVDEGTNDVSFDVGCSDGTEEYYNGTAPNNFSGIS